MLFNQEEPSFAKIQFKVPKITWIDIFLYNSLLATLIVALSVIHPKIGKMARSHCSNFVRGIPKHRLGASSFVSAWALLFHGMSAIITSHHFKIVCRKEQFCRAVWNYFVRAWIRKNTDCFAVYFVVEINFDERWCRFCPVHSRTRIMVYFYLDVVAH